jgi:hypothetical protein
MSPDQFLGYESGTQFTYHHKAAEYFRYVAENSPLAVYREYGTTYEGRPLCVCFVSSEENLARLEEYRKNNLIMAGFEEGTYTGRQVPFIWLAYNVHGNESAGMEAALKTLYTLVTGSFKGSADWLKSCIVVIDPCQNPDGRDLYTNRFRNSGNLSPNPDGNSWEHNQGWPGARSNHYMFDLNRDWVWQTQVETVQRIKLYNQIMPQVYADFHEMGAESTFFFAPGAEPWHEVITPWQHEFHKLMGDANAALFDENMKLYFTKETYDLFCPSYGDTWPLFNGAMGFTFEQGGGGFSGLAYKRESGDTLTLKMRIDGHFLASMATIKVSYENRDRLTSEFNNFFKDAREKPSFQYKSIIIKGTNEKSNLEDLFLLLGRNQIRYSPAGNIGKKLKGFDYRANTEGEVTIEKGDFLITAAQPQSHLVQVLFEPDSKSTDSITYDLSAWALPYLYNLNAFALKDKVDPLNELIDTASLTNEIRTDKPYGYVINYSGFNELKFIAALIADNVKTRYALKPFTVKGTSFNRGSFIIARGDNLNIEKKLDELVRQEAIRFGIRLIPASSGLADKGIDFGSMYSILMKKVKVAVLCGNGTSSSQVGELWYFFERELGYPLSLINTENIGSVNLSDYDVLMLTSGNYSKLRDTIFTFTKKGGRVIAFETAISVFSSDKSTSLNKEVELRNTERKAAEKKETSDNPELLKQFEDQRRYSLSNRSAGSIYKVKTDTTHPYAFGLGNDWFIIKRTATYPFLKSGNNIGYITDKEPVAGFAGYNFKKQVRSTLVIGSEKIGSGEAVYITDDPYFRAFWKSGRVLLGNVVLR